MEHATFVLGSWLLTVFSIAAYAAFILRRARALSKNATTEEMPWT